MSLTVLLPALTALLAAIFAAALVDQWRGRRHAYQAVWAVGMAFYAIAAGCEALAAANGWSDVVYRTWYVVGGVWTVGWLGLGTAFLLGKTRFGYGFALCLFLAGLFTFLTPRRLPAQYPDVGLVPVIYLILAGVLAAAVAVETYFQNWRWPWMAALAVVGATVVSVVIVAITTLPAPGYAVDSATGAPTAVLFPASLRLLAPFMNITGAFSLLLGALFSTYMFMPKRRVLDYSLDPGQPGERFLFNIFLGIVAIPVNFVVSLPRAWRAFRAGQLNSRVPATVLIAIGAFIPLLTDSLFRFGSTDLYQLGHLLGVVLLFAGFLVSVETFEEIRVPFTSIVLRGRREEAR